MTSIKLKFIVLILLISSATVQAQNYVGRGFKVSFFSSTPIEDIRAMSTSAFGLINVSKQEIAIQVPIKSFEFEKKLMQEHFNENYMESDKYPSAKFKGNIKETIDWSKNGEYQVNVQGVLEMHGVTQPRTISGKINIKDGTISLQSNFDVACKDHHIKIPSLVFTKIAEVIKVSFQGSMTSNK